MTNDQFTKLFTYLQDFRREFNKKLDEKASQASVDSLTKTVDGIVNRLDTYEIEQGSRNLQFDRILSWARHVSKKTGVPIKDL